MKRLAKTTLFLFLMVVSGMFTQCENIVEPDETVSAFRVVHYDALPAAIRSEVNTVENALKAAYAYKKEKPFGKLVAKRIHQSSKSNGTTSYTLGLRQTGEGFYYDNVVINEDAEGKLKSRIIRYQPDPDWFYRHKTEGVSYDTYSGEITIFNTAGEELSSVTLVSGQVQQPAAKATALKADGTPCEIIDIQEAGLEQEGEFYIYEITITVDCSGTGGGYQEEGMNTGFGNEGGEEGGGGGSPGGGNGGPGEPIETVPVEDEMEDEQITIDDSVTPCVENIITQLQEKDNHISVVPDINVTDSISHISQIILDLFSASQQYHINFEIGEAGPGVNASTLPVGNNPEPGQFTFMITLDEEFVTNATTLAIARTIIHESVHALLGYIYQDQPFSDLSNLLRHHIEINEDDENTNNLAQHEIMLQFAEAMGHSLAVWDDHNLPQDYYNSLSWSGGMLQTEAFELLSEEQQQAIENANIAEGQANAPATADAQGTNCN